jgi:GTPase
VTTRAGTIALIGRPNAGKSSLLNALVGEKLSIVTPKAQTTWRRVTGIHTSERAQMIFLDTPGLLEVKDLLQRAMLQEAKEALHEADVVLVVLDATRPLDDLRTLPGMLERAPGRRFAAINKIDAASADQIRAHRAWFEAEIGGITFPVSATTGQGIEALEDALETALPESPFLYPEDELASQPVRFFAAELVRETVFEQFRQEVPYSVNCTIEEFREETDPVFIGATLHVERESQKQIVIGEKGSAIRSLGQAARLKIEALIGRPVYLQLWVKVLPGWRRKRGHLSRFGFHVPEDDERKS